MQKQSEKLFLLNQTLKGYAKCKIMLFFMVLNSYFFIKNVFYVNK